VNVENLTHEKLEILNKNRRPDESLADAVARLFPEENTQIAPAPAPVATRPPAPIMSLEDDEEGLSDFDLTIPRISINQNTTQIEGATAGKFRNSVTGEEQDTIEVVFLKRFNGRVLFPENDISGERDCWSLDGIIPDVENIAKANKKPIAEKCVEQRGREKKFHCPYSEWIERNPPKCKETITLLGLEGVVPFYMSFHGTAIKPLRSFLGTIVIKKKAAKTRREVVNMRDFSVLLRVNRESNKRGTFYVPHFSQITPVEASRREELTSVFELLKDRQTPDSDVQVESSATDFSPADYERDEKATFPEPDEMPPDSVMRGS
jgi:hypothetical protein